ncbi:bleomycin resistance protein [Roseovarius sp. 2305UL8-3]|uniref:bleomycin resistance protein n=1 Tax=Roseovarius conchicola TaxID=3121636 RepID=UPI00352790CC
MITANLPARDFGETQAFYHRLGFETLYRGDNWMIMTWHGHWLEFFPHPDLDPADSWFSACLRIADIDALHMEWAKLGLIVKEGFPRLGDSPFELGGDVPRMFTLHDPNGSLWRVLEMGDPGLNTA